MTENEAIEILYYFNEKRKACLYFDKKEYQNFTNSIEMAISALSEIQRYRAIGTVEECQAARERQRGKKPIKNEYNHECCPNCGWIVYQEEWGGRYLPHCENCGQAIDTRGDSDD